LIATYGCRGDLRGLLESLTGMRLRLNLYRGNGAEKPSTEDAKQGKESYASSVARVAGSPVTKGRYT
jgi:hypothetical protein